MGVLPDVRRFAHIHSVMMRNLDVPHNDSSLVDSYFTIHMEDSQEQPLYTSEIVTHTRVRTFPLESPSAYYVDLSNPRGILLTRLPLYRSSEAFTFGFGVKSHLL
jgi:hypothetical protein